MFVFSVLGSVYPMLGSRPLKDYYKRCICDFLSPSKPSGFYMYNEV
jgi:hypothetical protein